MKTVALLAVLAGAPSLHAQLEIGTWVRQATPPMTGAITMTVEACCGGSGRRLTWTGMEGGTMTVESPLDGTEAPLLLLGGKPSGATMAIKRIDDHHAEMVMSSVKGQPSLMSKATLSADGKTLTVENTFTTTVGDQQGRVITETWVRK